MNILIIGTGNSGGFCERGPSYTWTPTGAELGNFNVTRSLD